MIPQLTPQDAENTKNGAKRLLPTSPAKRVKRNSLTKVSGPTKLKPSPVPALNLSATGIDPNASADLSKCLGAKPTWR